MCEEYLAAVSSVDHCHQERREEGGRGPAEMARRRRLVRATVPSLGPYNNGWLQGFFFCCGERGKFGRTSMSPFDRESNEGSQLPDWSSGVLLVTGAFCTLVLGVLLEVVEPFHSTLTWALTVSNLCPAVNSSQINLEKWKGPSSANPITCSSYPEFTHPQFLKSTVQW